MQGFSLIIFGHTVRVNVNLINGYKDSADNSVLLWRQYQKYNWFTKQDGTMIKQGTGALSSSYKKYSQLWKIINIIIVGARCGWVVSRNELIAEQGDTSGSRLAWIKKKMLMSF